MTRYFSEQTLLDMIYEDGNAVYDLADLKYYLTQIPTADVAPKSEVAREIIAFVHQLIDMQPYEGRWITTSGEEIIADVGYFFEGFEIVEKEILKKYTEEK